MTSRHATPRAETPFIESRESCVGLMRVFESKARYLFSIRSATRPPGWIAQPAARSRHAGTDAVSGARNKLLQRFRARSVL